MKERKIKKKENIEKGKPSTRNEEKIIRKNEERKFQEHGQEKSMSFVRKFSRLCTCSFSRSY